MPKIRVSLLTGRTIDQGKWKECGKLSGGYQESASTCQMDPEDMRRLGVRDGQPVRVTTKFGSVVLRASRSRRTPHPGVAFIPYGPWASVVMDPTTHGTGMPSLKGIPAEIEPAPEGRVLSLQELLQQVYGGKGS